MAARILVVDDEPAVRSLVVRVLREDGYDVVAVEDGQEAYETALKERFDVVITDNCMPGMTGAELVRKLRWRMPNLPIVHLDDRSLGAGYEFQIPEDVVSIPKPFDAAVIKSAVRSVLPETQ